jgi:hypothetical protein
MQASIRSCCSPTCTLVTLTGSRRGAILILSVVAIRASSDLHLLLIMPVIFIVESFYFLSLWIVAMMHDK